MWIWLVALGGAGVFTLALGLLHFFLPVLLDFSHGIPREGPPLRPLRLGPLSYGTTRQDVYGIAWVMNHAASYTLVSIGVVDLLAYRWLGSGLGPWLAGWIAGWWLLRAASQFYLGQRRGDWIVAGWFLLLALMHGGAAWL